jgi:hypothetical protein
MYGRRGIAIAAAVGLSAGAPIAVAAQDRGTCPAAERIGWIGIEEFHCNCTLTSAASGGDGAAEWTFRSEPVVDDVVDGSPAARVLRRGDVIVAVDGHPITTAEGGRLLASPEPGQTLRLTIRRDGKSGYVRVTPLALCPTDRRLALIGAPRVPTPPRRPGAAPAPTAPPVSNAERVAVTPPAPPAQLLPAGRLGFALTCAGCGWEQEAGAAEPRPYFDTPPQVYSVEPGSPAEQAGMRRGDVILQVDGLSITSGAGASRLASIQPRESVRYTIRRGGSTTQLSLRAGDRGPAAAQSRMERDQRDAEEEMILVLQNLERIAGMGDLGEMRRELTDLLRQLGEPAPAPASGRATPERLAGTTDALRYTATVGNAEVEVRGAGSVITTTFIPGKDLLIVTDAVRIRIRAPESERRRDDGR